MTNAMLSRRSFLRVGALTAGSCACAALFGCAENDAPDKGTSASSGLSSYASESTPSDPVQETLFVFDTIVTLTAYCTPELMERLVARCTYFEEHFSRTVEGSDVWNINNAHGAPVEVAAETADVIARGLEYGVRSNGLFDITIGAVSSLWDFKAGIKPDDGVVAEARAHVDYRNVSVDGTTVTLADPDAMIDLGGIAKGYIADDLARILRESGCESAVVNLGGNVYAFGFKPDGTRWRVGIQDPNAAASTAVIAAVECADTSVVTSGLYERTFELDGVRYHHILDPKTGYPAESDLVSSSVVSASSTEGDAIATWMFLLGHDGALAYLEAADGLEGLVVDDAGTITTTSSAPFTLR